MERVLKKFKACREVLSVNRLFSTYIWSNIIKFPDGQRYQINLNSFIRCLSLPDNAIGNVLILQGGIRHMNSNTYYVRTAGSLVTRKARLFIFEKLLPVCSFYDAHDVAMAINHIRKEFPGPLCVIGYSMGSILLWSYIALGYDQADFYVPTCGPLDLDRFAQVINENKIFRFAQEKSCKYYGVNNREELLEYIGSSLKEENKFKEKFIENLNQHQDKWLSKTIYIISSEDPISDISDIKLLNHPPLTYVVKGGWHCCLDSIFLSILLVNRFLKAYFQGITLKPNEISTEVGVTTIRSAW